eukprot:9421002-Pyramimonas_sp.AAC.1
MGARPQLFRSLARPCIRWDALANAGCDVGNRTENMNCKCTMGAAKLRRGRGGRKARLPQTVH